VEHLRAPALGGQQAGVDRRHPERMCPRRRRLRRLVLLGPGGLNAEEPQRRGQAEHGAMASWHRSSCGVATGKDAGGAPPACFSRQRPRDRLACTLTLCCVSAAIPVFWLITRMPAADCAVPDMVLDMLNVPALAVAVPPLPPV